MKKIKDLLRKLTFKDFRAYVLDNQSRQAEEIARLKDQLFLSNPVLIMDNIQMYLPYFYVDHIQKTIYSQRDFYEKKTLSYIKMKYPSVKRVVEVGANIGNHTLFYLTQMGVSHVDCFEPNAINRSMLERNIELNRLESCVTVHPVALGERESRGVESDFQLSNTGMNKVEVAGDNDDKTVSILPMDQFGFTKIDFIKIDVEGAEWEVLKGAAETIRKNRPVIMVEVFENNLRPVSEFLSSLGYVLKQTLEDHNLFFEPLNTP